MVKNKHGVVSLDAWFEIEPYEEENDASKHCAENITVDFRIMSENIKQRLLDRCKKTDEWQNNYSCPSSRLKIM